MPRPGALPIRRVAVAILLLGVLSSDQVKGTASDQKAATEDGSVPCTSSPTDVYRSACIRCHDSDGRGEAGRDVFPTIPDFTNPSWHASRDDQSLSRAILHGKGKAMKPMKKKLGSLDVTHMVSFVRAFRGGGLVVLDEAEVSASALHKEGARTIDSKPADRRPSATHAQESRPATAIGPAEAVYRSTCQQCHDPDGRGKAVRDTIPSIPDFTDPVWQGSRSDGELLRSISEGRGGLMPSMKVKLASASIGVTEMVAFVRGFRAREKVATAEGTSRQPPRTPPRPAVVPGAPSAATSPPAVSASHRSADRMREAAVLYRNHCAACHGTDGHGSAVRSAMPSVPDFSARSWQAGRGNAQLAVSILEGKGASMPSWRDQIRGDRVRDLVAFVRTFGPTDHSTSDPPTSDFAVRFRELREQWEELEGQIQVLSRPSTERTVQPPARGATSAPVRR